MFNKIEKFILALLLVFGIVLSSIAQVSNNLFVTGIKLSTVKGTKFAEIDINDLIKIKEIEVKKIGEKIVLNFPNYITKQGKIYPQVKILTKQFNDAIIKAIEANKPQETDKKTLPPVDEMNFEVTKFTAYNNPKSALKIFAVVTFNNAIEIECKIFDGKNGPWITWPSREESGNWIKQVLFKKNFKVKIETLLIQKYKVLKEESHEGWE